ncbi:hypothetical protein [Synechocystis sp. LKSZ1]|uniref:hypothetical protein n=1 Tax=Synechocystis sp. LKSZ1 TaxID=3144951 RepID=UPI00336C22EA
MTNLNWTTEEQQIAQQAIQTAYHREAQALIHKISHETPTIQDIDEVWQLHDYLSAKRHQMDGKYDSRYPVLIFVFANLLKEGWLLLEDLKGLEPDKLSKISALAKMS